MSTGLAKHRQIFESMREQIQAGHYQPGDRIPADIELGERFQVSRPTVARAIRDLERCGLVSRRPGSGTYVLESGVARTKMFGLLIPGLGETEIFEPICGSMARCAQAEGHSLVWGATAFTTSQGAESALSVCDGFIKDAVAGVFFAPLELTDDKDRVNHQITEKLTNAGIPLVLLDRDFVNYPARSGFDLVAIDNRRVGFQIASHLFDSGCRRLLFVARPNSAPTVGQRLAGIHEAARNFDGHLHVSHAQLDPKNLDALRGVLQAEAPDGIACANDATAASILDSLDRIGCAVPGDLMVTGVDDVRYAELLRVPLTTVHQPCSDLGQVAFRVMLDRVDHPEAPARDVLLGCELVVRASTTKKKDAAATEEP